MAKITGKFIDIQHTQGSGLAGVIVETKKGNVIIPFDWRLLSQLLENEGDIRGRKITYDEKTKSVHVATQRLI